MLKPFAIHALNKDNYGLMEPSSSINEANLNVLIRDVKSKVRGESQIAALLSWEEHILYAAARTVNSVFSLAEESGDRSQELSHLLTHMAVAGVGKERISDGEFQAANEALFPILADRISFLRPDELTIMTYGGKHWICPIWQGVCVWRLGQNLTDLYILQTAAKEVSAVQ